MDFSDRARQILRAAGLRVTIARAALVTALLRVHEPVSMEDAARLCGEDGGDPATVYRNLQALNEAGVLQPVRGVGRREMFELLAPAHHAHEGHHAHLSCTGCGKVECIEISHPPHKPAAPRGWAVDDVSVTVWGLCPECR